MNFRAAPLLASLAACALGPRARAAPLDDPHVGGLAFTGPTSGNLAAVYWNPAALGLLSGNNATLAATVSAVHTTVNRSAIDPATGAPGGGFDPGSATARDLVQPLRASPGPGGFAAASTDLNGDRVTLAVAAFSPFAEHGSFAPAAGGQDPTRYHRVDVDLRHLALVPALALRVGGELRVGFAPGFLFSAGRMTFDEDTALDAGVTGADCGAGAPCGVENPAAAARYHLDSGAPLLGTFAMTLATGVFYRRGRLDLGASYTSRPFGTGADGVDVQATRTRVDLPPRAGGGQLPCPVWQSSDCVSADIVYKLPDIIIAGIGYRPSSRVELTATLRFLTFSLHRDVDIRLSGASLQAAGLPERIVLYRGFQDVYDGRLQAAYTVGPRVRLGAALRAETSAVPVEDVNPDAVDGFKVEPALMAEVRPAPWLLLGAGYGFTFMPSVTVGRSTFDPTAVAACAAANGDLDDPACQARLRGAARPTAAGSYARTSQTFSLAATARF